MALTKEQISTIEAIYDQRRMQNQIKLDEHKKEAFSKIPELQNLDNERIKASNNALRAAKAGDNEPLANLRDTMAAIDEKESAFLLSYGYPSDYLSPMYYCEKCKDSGYINGSPCSCMKREISKLLYSRSDIQGVFDKENFDTFNYDLYSENVVDEAVGTNALNNIKNVVKRAKEFVDTFDENHYNLFLYGPAGTGKTFLTNCIAKELLDSSHSVIYLTAIQFFDLMADYTFNTNNSRVYSNVSVDEIFSCDLLIIDDLGTEMSNSFTESSLFDTLNERLIHHKSMIISTNLTFKAITEKYDGRIFSRLMGHFDTFKIFGDDLRIKNTI